MERQTGNRQPGMVYVAIAIFAVLVAAILGPGYTLGY
jgi:hypothetical protein